MIDISKNVKKTDSSTDQAGFSLMEYLVALILIGIALVAFLELTATGVKNGVFAKRLGDVKSLATGKAAELARDADRVVNGFKKGQRIKGSLTPGNPADGCFELLDGDGEVINGFKVEEAPIEYIDGKIKVIGEPKFRTPTARFVRQWMYVNDLPDKGEITVFVVVVSKDTNQIIRTAKAVKIDGLSNG
jgi:prepilin-type N-terminal cleavage/methylation domain-containing protein